jgi:hypothetical protein
MPTLDTPLHLDMHRDGKQRRSFSKRLKQSFKVLLGRGEIYGLHWGDPDESPPLAYVRDHFLMPYINPDVTVVEIGPGGGRWTRYMIGAKRIYAVDYHQELLDELKSHFNLPNVMLIKNNGNDFPGVASQAIDLVFSFGVFVHLDVEIINGYLRNIKPLLKANSNVIIQYSDKTKPLGRSNTGFSENDPEKMRKLVLSHGYTIYEEDIQTLWHSALIRFGVGKASGTPNAG